MTTPTGSTIEGFIQKGPVVVTADSIIIHTTSLPTGIVVPGNRIDILYYNHVNKLGELLSSIVYMSDVAPSQHGQVLVYKPTTIYNNSTYEKLRSISGDGYRWSNADIIVPREKPLALDNVLIDLPYKHADVVNDFGPLRTNNAVMFDGWYTIVSVFPGEYSDYSAVLAGDLRSEGHTIKYAVTAGGTQWKDITDIDASVPIANLVRTVNPFANYANFDFIVVDRMSKMYAQAIRGEARGVHAVDTITLAAKLRSIKSLHKHGNMQDAQYLINSINTNVTTN